MKSCGCCPHSASSPCLWTLATSLADVLAVQSSNDLSSTAAFSQKSQILDSHQSIIVHHGVSVATVTPVSTPQSSPLSKPVRLSEEGGIDMQRPISPISAGIAAPCAVFPDGRNKKRRRQSPVGKSAPLHPCASPAEIPPTSRPVLRKKARRRTRSRSPRAPPSRPSVLTIAPTVLGISEAARILRSSICQTLTKPRAAAAAARECVPTSETSNPAAELLSFPTETVYTLATCIPIKPTPRKAESSVSVTRSESNSSISSLASSISLYSSDDNATTDSSSYENFSARKCKQYLLFCEAPPMVSRVTCTHIYFNVLTDAIALFPLLLFSA